MKLSSLRRNLYERYDPVYQYPENQSQLQQIIHQVNSYHVPRSSNIQKQIADFYAICAMHHDWMNNLVWKEKGIWDAPLKEEFKKALQYAYKAILTSMKDDILKKLRFSIWRELFHIADAIYVDDPHPKMTQWNDYEPKEKTPYSEPTGEYYKQHVTHESIDTSNANKAFMQQYNKLLKQHSKMMAQNGQVAVEMPKPKQPTKAERRKMYREIATKNLSKFINNQDLVRHIVNYAFTKGDGWEMIASNLDNIEDYAVHAFEELPWREAYGGPAWAKICKYTANLRDASTLPKVERAIDDVMDLQHNTGSVFNKIPGYSSEMMKEILDFKYSNHPRNLARYTSTDIADMLNYFYRPVKREETPVKIKSKEKPKIEQDIDELSDRELDEYLNELDRDTEER